MWYCFHQSVVPECLRLARTEFKGLVICDPTIEQAGMEPEVHREVHMAYLRAIESVSKLAKNAGMRSR